MTQTLAAILNAILVSIRFILLILGGQKHLALEKCGPAPATGRLQTRLGSLTDVPALTLKSPNVFGSFSANVGSNSLSSSTLSPVVVIDSSGALAFHSNHCIRANFDRNSAVVVATARTIALS